MNCPRCETHPPLQELHKKTMHFFGCHTCHGVLLEKRQIGDIVQRVHPAEVEPEGYFSTLVAAAEFNDNKKSIVCPHCKYDMYETENRGIALDFCLNCQAIWFDDGELQQVLHRVRAGERINLVPLPQTEVDHASGLILHLLREQWL